MILKAILWILGSAVLWGCVTPMVSPPTSTPIEQGLVPASKGDTLGRLVPVSKGDTLGRIAFPFDRSGLSDLVVQLNLKLDLQAERQVNLKVSDFKSDQTRVELLSDTNGQAVLENVPLKQFFVVEAQGLLENQHLARFYALLVTPADASASPIAIQIDLRSSALAAFFAYLKSEGVPYEHLSPDALEQSYAADLDQLEAQLRIFPAQSLDYYLQSAPFLEAASRLKQKVVL